MMSRPPRPAPSNGSKVALLSYCGSKATLLPFESGGVPC
jgi:hypothetical protein